MPAASLHSDRTRLRIVIHGAVQGVGFRPFVYRLAVERGLDGWVGNTPQGVICEFEGDPRSLAPLPMELEARKPDVAQIHCLEAIELEPVGHSGFEIRESVYAGRPTAVVMPDLATCPDCVREIFDPSNRRYRYPFTNCTNCGPRFTIISSLPYDRPNTTMRQFAQCPDCQREYADPGDRRFHAQPNACPTCGPRVQLWDATGNAVEADWAAIEHAADLIRSGRTVAVKDVGGFHLMCDPAKAEAVRTLRSRKRREEKPFALLMPSIDLARGYAELSQPEERTLSSSSAPIVLVRRSGNVEAFREAVAVENPFLGIMLPSNPLQHLLMQMLQIPVIATSGNLSDEPICIDEREALHRLLGIADAFLVHDRPILRHADDSIVRHLLGREQVLRRARGFAPLPIHTGRSLGPMLGVGAHLKNSVAIATDRRIVISQHIGDLDTAEACDAFERVAVDLPALHGITPEQIVCDLHPDYRSSQYARASGLPCVGIQHHLAHITACMAENELRPPVLGISWDGTGLGTDGTVWGGEFIRVDDDQWERIATLRPFRLPGGDAAVREPRRSALSVLTEAVGPEIISRTELATIAAFESGELRPLQQMIGRGVRSPVTTSAGRLFDAVASIVGLRQRVRHEGQAAMELEWAARASNDQGAYPLPVVKADELLLLDWGPMVREILEDIDRSFAVPDIARRFHAALAQAMAEIARAIGIRTVVLSGGCFQNGLLTELAVDRLRKEGFEVFWHQRVPPNDGGIALGQVVAAAMNLVERNQPVDAGEPA